MKALLPVLVLCLIPAALQAAAPHPTVLTVKYKGEMLPVMKLIGSDPVVLVDGKEKRIRTEPEYLPHRVPEFSEGSVQVLNMALGGVQTRFVHSANDAANTEAQTGAHGGLAEFTATLKAERALTGAFITVVIYSPLVFVSDVPLAGTQIVVRELPALPAGTKVPVRLTSKMFTLVPGQEYFVQIFDGTGREILTQAAPQAWKYYELMERYQLKEAVGRYREKFAGQNHAAQPVVTIRPVLPKGQAVPEGTLTVQLTVTPEGLVDEVSFSETYAPGVAKALQDALGGWLFLPRLKAGEPVRSTVRMPLKF